MFFDSFDDELGSILLKEQIENLLFCSLEVGHSAVRVRYFGVGGRWEGQIICYELSHSNHAVGKLGIPSTYGMADFFYNGIPQVLESALNFLYGKKELPIAVAFSREE